MSDGPIHDEAALVIIRALRTRMLDALLPAFEAICETLEEEGHAELLVCQAAVSAAGELFGHAILDNCAPVDAPDLFRHSAKLVADFVIANAAVEAEVEAGTRAPVGVTLQ